MSAGQRSPSLVGAALRRYAVWIILITVLVGVPLSVVLGQFPEVQHVVLQGYVIADAAEDSRALVTINTDRSARDYASVLRSDDDVLDVLANAAGRPREQVRADLAVGYVPRAATIVVRYRAPSRAEVLRVLAALEHETGLSGLPAGGIPANRIRPLGEGVVTRVRNPLNPFPGAGAVLVAGGAALVAVLVERSRPRTTDRRELRKLTGRPVLELRDDEDVQVLVRRVLAGSPSQVALLPQAGVPPTAVTAVRAALEDAGVAVVRAPSTAAVLLLVPERPLRDIHSALADLPAGVDAVLALCAPSGSLAADRALATAS